MEKVYQVIGGGVWDRVTDPGCPMEVKLADCIFCEIQYRRAE